MHRLGGVLAWVLVGCGLDPVPPGAATDGASSSDGSGGSDDSGDSSESDDGPQPAGPDSAPDPSTFGPYPVGVLTFAIEDRSRGEGAPRFLVVEVWYPATDAAIGVPTVTYGPEDILRPEATALLSESLDVGLETAAVRDAAVREQGGPYPVVMFSHGSGGIRMQSTYLTVALASHGYVVVAPDHYGNTLSDIILDGDLTSMAIVQSLGDRPKDLDFVVEHLQSGGVSVLTNAMDFDAMGVVGHSFGALTSIRWMGLGADVDAVVAQAPPPLDITWLGVPGDLADRDVPIMLQVGGIDRTTPPEDADTIWQAASPPRTRMTLGKAGHFTFSDICSIDREALAEAADLVSLAEALDDGCAPENTDPITGAVAMRHFTIGYFNVHLRKSEPTRALLTEAIGKSIVGDELSYEDEP